MTLIQMDMLNVYLTIYNNRMSFFYSNYSYLLSQYITNFSTFEKKQMLFAHKYFIFLEIIKLTNCIRLKEYEIFYDEVTQEFRFVLDNGSIITENDMDNYINDAVTKYYRKDNFNIINDDFSYESYSVHTPRLSESQYIKFINNSFNNSINTIKVDYKKNTLSDEQKEYINNVKNNCLKNMPADPDWKDIYIDYAKYMMDQTLKDLNPTANTKLLDLYIMYRIDNIIWSNRCHINYSQLYNIMESIVSKAPVVKVEKDLINHTFITDLKDRITYLLETNSVYFKSIIYQYIIFLDDNKLLSEINKNNYSIELNNSSLTIHEANDYTITLDKMVEFILYNNMQKGRY